MKEKEQISSVQLLIVYYISVIRAKGQAPFDPITNTTDNSYGRMNSEMNFVPLTSAVFNETYFSFEIVLNTN